MSGGFQIPFQGIKYQGMGHCGTSYFADAGAIYYNPAGISLLRRPSLSLGVSGVTGFSLFRDDKDGHIYDNKPTLATPFYAYFAQRMGKGKWTAGLGLYTPFGSALAFNDDFPGRFIAQSSTLTAIYFQPTAAYKCNDKLSIGGGIVVSYAELEITRSLPVTDVDGLESQVNISGEKIGWGYNVGISYRMNEKLNFGFAYRSRVGYKIADGFAKFSLPASLQEVAPKESTFSASVKLPETLSGAVTCHINSNTLLSGQIDYTGWRVFKELRFVLDTPVLGTTTVVSNREYRGAFVYRIGFQNTLKEWLTLRAGVVFDQGAADAEHVTPDVPDNNHFGLVAGSSFLIKKKLSLDITAGWVEGKERRAENTQYNYYGLVKTRAFIAGLGLSYDL